jgi:hypothetical protein
MISYRDFSPSLHSLQAIQQKRCISAALLLTHLGSNQDSAEPKSDVLPITPWVIDTLTVLQN